MSGPQLVPMPETLDLAWLLGCLDRAARLLRESGFDVDALVIEAHRAELASGRNWPGMATTGAIRSVPGSSPNA